MTRNQNLYRAANSRIQRIRPVDPRFRRILDEIRDTYEAEFGPDTSEEHYGQWLREHAYLLDPLIQLLEIR